MEFIEANKLLSSHQPCYKKGHSTQTALISVLDDAKWAIEKRMVTILVFFVFSKAFDCIPHKALLTKFQSVGITGLPLSWFFSCLQGRQQAVWITREQHSGYRPIALGVPQGSVLGPILFGIFSSDVPRVLTHCKCRKYADDTQIYLHALPAKLNDALGLVERDAQAVADCTWNNGLELNTKKTQVIILGRAHYTLSIDLTRLRKICVNNTPLSFTTEVKNLGVTMNQTLEW